MTVPSIHDRALFEVAKRLLCQILNEGLVSGILQISDSTEANYLCLLSNSHVGHTPEKCIRVKLHPDSTKCIFTRSGRIVSLVRPEMLMTPVLLVDKASESHELRPTALFKFACSLFTKDIDESISEQLALGLENSAANTEGLKTIGPKDLPEILTPTLAFVSVLRTETCISGPFEEILEPLLIQLEVPTPESEDRIVIPCLSLQLPNVYRHFPSAVLLKSVSQCADTQASMRTLTIRPQFNFTHHIKLSIACQVTSDVRAIRPCQTLGGQLVKRQLGKFLPADLWWFKEAASVSGSQAAEADTQENQDKARHIGCILREDVEPRARRNNEALIVAGSLAQCPVNDSITHAESVFGLETVEQKQHWFRSYVLSLFKAFLPSLVQYGIGMEAHGQNTLVRVCLKTKEIKGFVFRDFEGIKVHIPTLEKLGIELCMTSPGCTKNLESIWNKVHHALFQNHIGNLIYALGIDKYDGWTIVRDELFTTLKPDMDPRSKELYDYILRDTMAFKCFLKMRMGDQLNDRDERQLPNVLLMGSSRWESILNANAPELKRD
ncbi:ferric iron reductase FhuF-like transporter-domain-containing protein [Xylogone sp. PMI_703]|nr:ferric iron reductase FhuF-like transporter-domain-containing protein [Xylogone sp. PMI_703]